jgi:hypothetical protein
MFSLDKFYQVLFNNLLEPCDFEYEYYYPFGSTDIRDLQLSVAWNWFSNNLESNVNMFRLPEQAASKSPSVYCNKVWFFDQEPLSESAVSQYVIAYYPDSAKIYPGERKRLGATILANSEISDFKNSIVDEHRLIDWYYFFHGFLALYWYNDFKYFDINRTACFSKVFINYNNLVRKDRSYRLSLVSELLKRKLDSKGLISLPLNDEQHGNIQQELTDPNSKLSAYFKKQIENHILTLDQALIIDKSTTTGADSATLNLVVNQRALWHVVSETNFYHAKLHLTEKIFKPIVSFRPFILVGAPGNLQYLRSYGFKTFGNWIDESYDLEQDHDKRILMIVDQIERLSELSEQEQKRMFEEMRPVLEHNFNHFYGDFKRIIVSEMVWGFYEAVDGLVDDSHVDYDSVIKRLTQ